MLSDMSKPDGLVGKRQRWFSKLSKLVHEVDSSECTKNCKDGSEAKKLKVLRLKLVYLYRLCFVKYCFHYSQI